MRVTWLWPDIQNLWVLVWYSHRRVKHGCDETEAEATATLTLIRNKQESERQRALTLARVISIAPSVKVADAAIRQRKSIANTNNYERDPHQWKRNKGLRDALLANIQHYNLM